MSLKFLSLDTETTSLHPLRGVIIEVGGCVADFDGNIYEEFNWCIDHDKLWGDPQTLEFNAELIAYINELKQTKSNYEGNDPKIIKYNELNSRLDHWIRNKFRQDIVILAGKNFDKFDRGFFDSCGFWKDTSIKFGYSAALDPGVLYFDPRTDRFIPNLATCCERAGINSEITHRACEDARKVVKCISAYYRRT